MASPALPGQTPQHHSHGPDNPRVTPESAASPGSHPYGCTRRAMDGSRELRSAENREERCRRLGPPLHPVPRGWAGFGSVLPTPTEDRISGSSLSTHGPGPAEGGPPPRGPWGDCPPPQDAGNKSKPAAGGWAAGRGGTLEVQLTK